MEAAERLERDDGKQDLGQRAEGCRDIRLNSLGFLLVLFANS